ncbi:MAG: serine/threonine-protein kinase [Planctomycetota bacterium]|nr:serine/threonine-protein kinase [Planctomycetota bacterium]
MTFTHKPGSKPLPRYRIQRGIGRGGFGEVYFAVSDAGKEVALKSVQRNLDIELRGVTNCLNLKHPNLVALHDICKDQRQQPWVIMEYVGGPNLRQVIEQSPGGLPLHKVQHWITGAIAGVKHLHQAGVVHRDLKPENIFDDKGIVKVGDYGLSTVIQPAQEKGTEGVGTVHYMAPEVGRGEYGLQVDIYAFGVILHELVTGAVPFDGETKNEVIIKHLTATPCLDDVPYTLRSIIETCLQKDPSQRFYDLDSLSERLEIAFESTVLSEIPIADVVDVPQGTEGEAILDAVPHISGNISPNESATIHQLSAKFDFQQHRDSFQVFRYIVAAILVLGVISNPWIFAPIVVLGLIFYLPAFALLRIFRAYSKKSSAPIRYESHQQMDTRPVSYLVGSKKWRLAMREQLACESFSYKSVTWLLSSALVPPLALLLSLIFVSLIYPESKLIYASFAPFIWSASLTSVAAVGLLALSQVWQVEEDHDISQRVTLAALGSVVGILAYLLHQYLMLDTQFELTRDVEATQLPEWILFENSPTILAFVSHFSVLFFLVNWYRLTDPLRKKRFQVWGVLVAVICEWCVQQILPLSQPATMFFAAQLGVALQTSSVWLSKTRQLSNRSKEVDFIKGRFR